MATIVNLNGIDEIDLTLPGNTTISTVNGVTSITNKLTGLALSYKSVSANYAIQLSDFQIFCTSGTFTVTLPDATTSGGSIFSIKNQGTGTITVNTTSSQLIDGSLFQTLTQYDNLTVASDGTNWSII